MARFLGDTFNNIALLRDPNILNELHNLVTVVPRTEICEIPTWTPPHTKLLTQVKEIRDIIVELRIELDAERTGKMMHLNQWQKNYIYGHQSLENSDVKNGWQFDCRGSNIVIQWELKPSSSCVNHVGVDDLCKMILKYFLRASSPLPALSRLSCPFDKSVLGRISPVLMSSSEGMEKKRKIKEKKKWIRDVIVVMKTFEEIKAMAPESILFREYFGTVRNQEVN